jgi:hypothetical protein
MRKLALAEWLLSRFRTPSHASSIVGDLVEDSVGRARVTLWLSVCAVLLALAWRHLVAFAIALCLGLFAFDFLHNLAYNGYAAYLPVRGWRMPFDLVCLAGILLSFGMPYTAIRYGLKNEFTRQTLAIWGLTRIVAVYWWVPFVSITCAASDPAVSSLRCSPRKGGAQGQLPLSHSVWALQCTSRSTGLL